MEIVMEKTYKAKEPLTIAIIALVIALAGFVYSALSYYQDKYSNPGIDTGSTANFTFKVNSALQPYAAISIKPTSGEFDYGLTHTTGSASMQYSAYFKNATSSYYTTLYNNGALAYIGRTYGPYGHIGVSSTSSYVFKITKNNYWTTQSVMKVDYMIH